MPRNALSVGALALGPTDQPQLLRYGISSTAHKCRAPYSTPRRQWTTAPRRGSLGALELARHATRITPESNHPAQRIGLQLALAKSYIEVDRSHDAQHTLASVHDATEHTGGVFLPWYHLSYALLAFHTGRRDEALAEIEAGLDPGEHLATSRALRGLAAVIESASRPADRSSSSRDRRHSSVRQGTRRGVLRVPGPVHRHPCERGRRGLRARLHPACGLVRPRRRPSAQPADPRLPAVDVHRGTRGPRRTARHGWEAHTGTEHIVAGHVADGHSNPEIATRMSISRRTVSTHVSNICRKLEMASSVELAAEDYPLAAPGPRTAGELTASRAPSPDTADTPEESLRQLTDVSAPARSYFGGATTARSFSCDRRRRTNGTTMSVDAIPLRTTAALLSLSPTVALSTLAAGPTHADSPTRKGPSTHTSSTVASSGAATVCGGFR